VLTAGARIYAVGGDGVVTNGWTWQPPRATPDNVAVSASVGVASR
jgi:hypothetical protein